MQYAICNIHTHMQYVPLYPHILISLQRLACRQLTGFPRSWRNNPCDSRQKLFIDLSAHVGIHLWKSFNTFVAGFWPLGHLGKQQQYEGENLVKHDDPTSIFPWQRKYFPLYFLKFYSTVVLFIVPLSAKLSALPVLVLVHVLVFVLWLIPMQSSHLPSARAHLDRRS